MDHYAVKKDGGSFDEGDVRLREIKRNWNKLDPIQGRNSGSRMLMTSNTQATTLNPKLSMKLEDQNSLDTLGLDSVEALAPPRKPDDSPAQALETEER